MAEKLTRDEHVEVITALRESEAKYKEVFDSMVDVFVRVNKDGSFEMISPSIRDVFGYEATEMLGKIAADYYVDPFEGHCLMNLIVKDGHCENIQSRVYSKDRVIKVISINAKAYRDSQGNNLGIDCIIRDITAQKNAEAEIQLKNELLEESEKIAHLGHINWRLPDAELTWSNEVYRIFGVALGVSISTKLTMSMVHPDDLMYVRKNFSLAVRQIKDFNLEHRIIRADNGEVVWVQVQMQLRFSASGKLLCVLGTVLDITEKKKDQQALLQSEEEFRSIYENTYSGIHLIDVNGKFLKANQRFVELLGYSEQELLKMKLSDVTHPDNIAKTQEKLEALVSGKISHFEAEKRYIRKTGEELICNIAITAPIGIDGRPDFLTGSLTDITETKKIQEVLKGISEIQNTFIGKAASKKIFNKILEVLLKTTQSKVGYIGEVQEQDGLSLLIPHAQMELVRVNSPVINDNESFANIFKIFTKQIIRTRKPVLYAEGDGMLELGTGPFEIENFIGLPLFHNSAFVGIVGVANKKWGYGDDDIRLLRPFLATCSTLISAYKNEVIRDTEREASARMKEAFMNQLELKVAERTEDLQKIQKELSISLEKEKNLGALKSRFVSTASHQFRTPLTVIQMNMGILSVQKDLMGETLKQSFEKINHRIVGEIARMTEMINDVLILGKIESGSIIPEFESIDFVELCQSIIDGYNEIQDDNRRMFLNVIGTPSLVELDGKLIAHAISNFVSNAFKYSIDKPAPSMTLLFRKGLTQLSIIDYGVGIPKEDLANLFEPFYRGSNVAEVSGTGLGTSIAKEYIELNRGAIEVRSTVNEGTEFILQFNH